MNIAADDPERERLRRLGWQIVDPHRVARTPRTYRRYLASALAEFTAIKGVDVAWRTGWISDRAAAFLALGRPVITEDTGAERYLPAEKRILFYPIRRRGGGGCPRGAARLVAAVEASATVRARGLRLG